MDQLRMVTYESLPMGCPFIVGGGLIRDAILGGRPSDIDIWLPANIFRDSPDVFRRSLYTAFPDSSVDVVFELGRRNNDNPFADLDPTAHPDEVNYGDLNNHWVLEMQREGWPKVNFMRSLHNWDNNAPQAFFNSIMRSFDIDACMFFIGWMPGQANVNTVIMPQHMLQTPGTNYRMNELYWNQHRANVTSAARIESRMIKMSTKYNFAVRTMDAMRRHGLIIPQNQIVATPVPFRRAVREICSRMPLPTMQNRSAVYNQNTYDQKLVEVTNFLELAKSREARATTTAYEAAVNTVNTLRGGR